MSNFVQENIGKIGIVFDIEDSKKILELTEYYQVDMYNLLASAIDSMYIYWEQNDKR